MEVTLQIAPETFQNDNPDVKFRGRTFQNVRLQCCCTYHTNKDYIQKVINNLFLKNGKSTPYPDNDALIFSALCDFNSFGCIIWVCQTCKSFPKIDTLDIHSLKCSKSCLREDKNGSDHIILVHQFDQF